jgi:hypothetical protein
MLALAVQFSDELNADDLARTIDEMEASIRRAVPDVNRIFIEAESILQTHPARRYEPDSKSST